MDPARNPAVCDCSINHHPFGSFSPWSNPDCDFECHAVCDKGRCGFTLRVEAGRCGSKRFNTDINTELKSLEKILNTTEKVFSPYRSHGILRNWHGLRCGYMRVKPGRYGFNSVWTRFEIRLGVTVALVWYFSTAWIAQPSSWFRCRPISCGAITYCAVSEKGPGIQSFNVDVRRPYTIRCSYCIWIIAIQINEISKNSQIIFVFLHARAPQIYWP
jgi:hypothetical protein